MLRRTLIIAPLLAASAAALPALAQVQERAAVSPPSPRTVTCPAGACVAATCDASTCSGGSLSLPASSIEISSWSWGASNPSSSRDAGSGMATGKRQHRPVTKSGGSLSSAAACTADAPCPGGGTVHLALAGRKGWDGCVKGSHIASAQLSARGGSGKVSLQDLHVMSCDDGQGRAILSYGSASMAPSSSSSR